MLDQFESIVEKITADPVKSLSPYTPGKPEKELKREMGIDTVYKLASNENPVGPSPLAIDAIQRALTQLHRYPDGNAYELREAIASHYFVNHNQITFGNGSSDILEFAVRAFVEPTDSVVVSQHAFAIYDLATQAIGAEVIKVPAQNYGHDLVSMANAVQENTKVVFVANPNNPTSTWVKEAELRQFLQRVPQHVIVVLDEAYGEFMEHQDEPLVGWPNSVQLLQEFPNIIITRTFSKVYGLAALRVGYGISHPAVADRMNRVRPPFNVNALAQAAALAAFKDLAGLEACVEQNTKGLKQIFAGLDDLGLSYLPSQVNFITFFIGDRDARSIFNSLLQRGVIVRPLANYEMPDALRVSVGTEEENQAFLTSLRDILSD
ncbi:MAG: histidinol-phosphate transaminase [Pseudomonadota bacterium]|nr:histidinol-phosphate transaminase [Pseudomonadota bacterium]